MIELVFVVCLMADPAACETRSLQFVEPLDLRACALGAQMPLAQWSARHPGHRIESWRCRVLDVSSAEL